MKTIKYIVQEGDILFHIGKNHGIHWRHLAEFNHLDNPHLIYPGDTIFIPITLSVKISQLLK